jgi:hypothetical protein
MCSNPNRAILALAFALCVTVVSLGQPQEAAGTLGPFTGEPRFLAPFSANAVTKVVQRTPQGRRDDRTMVAAYYRDSFGRVRVE